jgi:hypothetical protein
MKRRLDSIQRLLLLTALLGFSAMFANGATKQNLEQEQPLTATASSSVGKSTLGGNTGTLSKNTEATPSKKALKSPKKARSRATPQEVAPESGCFTQCLERSVDPGTVAGCLTDCAGGNKVNCAVCLGVAVIVVASCAWACS